jgi:uncharacterized phage infection (PIP) family protein YhgE
MIFGVNVNQLEPKLLAIFILIVILIVLHTLFESWRKKRMKEIEDEDRNKADSD